MAQPQAKASGLNLHYLTYGSNLHPVRLQKRIPSASLAGTVEMPGWMLSFTKRSRDGSGKCTIATADSTKSVFGAVYEIDPREKPLLDRIEGVGSGYDVRWMEPLVNGARIRAFLYIASREYLDEGLKPYRWYKDLVLAGARHHHFPAEYIKALEAVEATEDRDDERRRTNERILK